LFQYSDPSGRNFISNVGAEILYRRELDRNYRLGARVRNSAFTLLEAFENLLPQQSEIQPVEWPAFPVLAGQSDWAIDNNRFMFQDEYVEWRVTESGGGLTITFTTEFPEYFEAFAGISFDAVRDAIRDVVPGANPAPEELFGPGSAPDSVSERQRINRFRRFRESNPWNNGEKDILCLTQGFNTLGALINLLVQCSIPRPDLEPAQVCAAVARFCGDERNSDPRISVTVQNAALARLVVSAVDPIGIAIERLEGSWTLDDETVDMTTASVNGAKLWTITRNGRRAVLHIPAGTDLRLNGAPVTSGAQVSRVLIVASRVRAASSVLVPEWARAGNEDSVPQS